MGPEVTLLVELVQETHRNVQEIGSPLLACADTLQRADWIQPSKLPGRQFRVVWGRMASPPYGASPWPS
jgi:hypothetical protein